MKPTSSNGVVYFGRSSESAKNQQEEAEQIEEANPIRKTKIIHKVPHEKPESTKIMTRE